VDAWRTKWTNFGEFSSDFYGVSKFGGGENFWGGNTGEGKGRGGLGEDRKRLRLDREKSWKKGTDLSSFLSYCCSMGRELRGLLTSKRGKVADTLEAPMSKMRKTVGGVGEVLS